jgi:circadian clock protein KaiC
MSDRLGTGVAGLDGMLGGGLIRESISLVSGKPGTGKTTLATQFLLQGISRGEQGVYLSLDEEKDLFFRNMESHGWDLKRLEYEGKFYFEFLRSDELAGYINSGYQVLDHQIRKMRAKRLVIDSVTTYLLLCDDEMRRRNELKKLFDNIRKWKVTAVLTGEAKEGDAGYGVDYMVDAIIRLHSIRRKHMCGERRGFVEVEKMRGSMHSRELFEARIYAGGLDIPAGAIACEALKY